MPPKTIRDFFKKTPVTVTSSTPPVVSEVTAQTTAPSTSLSTTSTVSTTTPNTTSPSNPSASTSSSSPPTCSKRKKTTSEVNKSYDDWKRVRLFQESWKKEFPWLLHDNGYMTCKYCTSFPRVADEESPLCSGMYHLPENYPMEPWQEQEACYV